VDRSGYAHVVPDNARDLRAWSSAIRHAAETAMAGRPVIRGAVRVQAVFTLLRPRGHYGVRGLLPSAPLYPTTTPDGDKLERASWDALKGVVWHDDAQVVEWHGRKVYGEVPGLHLRVTAI
jgi:crossover junction endodeoxyribonuclease RusA